MTGEKTQIHRGEGNMKAKTEAELGVMQPQAKETKKSDNHQKLEETRKVSPLDLQRP